MNLSKYFLEPIVTPMLEIGPGLYAKAELCQPTGSVKDRFVFSAIKKAFCEGEIDENSVLVEATSGNTGISLAAAGAALGLPVKIVMPRNMSDERKDMLRRFGATIIEVGDSDFAAAIAKRDSLLAGDKKYWSPCQFENSYNIEVHRNYTAPEIHADMQALGIDQWDFMSGAGTGGTLMGLLQWCKDQPVGNHRVTQVAPLEGARDHGIQGINDGADFLLDRDSLSDQVLVSTNDAINAAREFAKTHGLLVGISSGANIVAGRGYLNEYPDRNVVILLCDRGERYFSLL